MNIIRLLLHPDPECRATVKDVEKDGWVTQPIDINLYSWEQVLPNCGMYKLLFILWMLKTHTFLLLIFFMHSDIFLKLHRVPSWPNW